MSCRFPFRAGLLFLAVATGAAPVAASAQSGAQSGARSSDGTADYLRAPAGGGEGARCDWFSRMRRFTDVTKRDCDDGRAVKTGPITGGILDRCRAEQGGRFGAAPIGDLLDGFSREVAADGLGNACHQIKLQAWDLVAQ